MRRSSLMKYLVGMGFVVSLAGTTGCAFGTRHAELTYPPSSPDEGAIETVDAAERAPAVSREIVLKVSDERTERDRIGNVRNGFGMDTADVITDDDVLGWVEGALSLELANAGYNVVANGSEPLSDDAISLTTEIVEVYCDVFMTYDGDVSLMVTMVGNDQEPVRKQYEGEGGVGMNWAATASSYAESLSLALQNAISKILIDLAQYE